MIQQDEARQPYLYTCGSHTVENQLLFNLDQS